MLFKEAHLQGIKSGTIKFAFRKWKKIFIKKGTLLKTSIGLVELVDINMIEEFEITEDDCHKAGFTNRNQLSKSLRQTDEGSIYKVEVRYHSADPRIALREKTVLTDEKFEELKEKLARYDKYSKKGNWTRKVLLIIKTNPGKRAMELAQITGFEKEWLKLNVRKLKNLGLTISLDSGYELSPFGEIFLERILKES